MTAPSAPVIRFIELRPVSFRLMNPFVTAAGKKTRTHNVQIFIDLSNGLRGIAEASSSLAMPSESQVNLLRVLKDMVPELRGKPLDDIRGLIALCWRLSPFHPTAAAAMECALLDAYTRAKGQPLAQYFGKTAHIVETDLTLSVAAPDRLYQAARAAAKRGFRKLKVKLAGDSAAKDADRLRAVHRACPSAALVADGNQGLNLSQALQLTQLLEKSGIRLRFLEQPFPRHDLRSMRHFRARCHVPLFADESVRTTADALRLFESGAADGVNIKVAKSGLLGAMDIIHIAQRFDKRLAIGCMEESKVGLAASVHLACGTGLFEWVDLDSVFLLEKSTVRGGFSTKGPKLSVKGIRAGIGVG